MEKLLLWKRFFMCATYLTVAVVAELKYYYFLIKSRIYKENFSARLGLSSTKKKRFGTFYYIHSQCQLRERMANLSTQSRKLYYKFS